MKKTTIFKVVALLTLSVGLLFGCQNSDAAKKDDGHRHASVLTEQELLTQLNEETRNLYLNLNEEGRQLARELAGSNTTTTDKNLAVQVAAQQMQEKSGPSSDAASEATASTTWSTSWNTSAER